MSCVNVLRSDILVCWCAGMHLMAKSWPLLFFQLTSLSSFLSDLAAVGIFQPNSTTKQTPCSKMLNKNLLTTMVAR